MNKFILILIYVSYAGMKKMGFKNSEAIMYSLSMLSSLTTLFFVHVALIFAFSYDILDKNDELLDSGLIILAILILGEMIILHHFFFKSEPFDRKFTKIENTKTITEHAVALSILLIALSLVSIFVMMVVLAFIT